MFDKIKQLKELRDQAKNMKDQLAEVTVSAQTMHDKITVVMDGNQEVISIDIDPTLLTADNKEELEKELAKAINDAAKKAKMEMARQFQQGGFSLPNLGN
ncbi:MAG: YbaB/EbfC family nucleoid-associated protein [Patescibacteria group bacterium]